MLLIALCSLLIAHCGDDEEPAGGGTADTGADTRADTGADTDDLGDADATEDPVEDAGVDLPDSVADVPPQDATGEDALGDDRAESDPDVTVDADLVADPDASADGDVTVDADLVADPDASADADVTTDPDASADADIPFGEVIVVVNDYGPVSGAPVFFNDSAGELIEVVHTDIAGLATYELAAGGMVTAMVSSEEMHGGQLLYTIAGVEPGDVIRVGNTSYTAATEVGTATIRSPSSVEEANEYGVSVCSNNYSSPTFLSAPELDVRDNCYYDDDRFDAISYALTESGGDLLAFTGARGLQLSEGSVDVTLDAWTTEFDTFSATLNNISAGATDSSFSANAQLAHWSPELNWARDETALTPAGSVEHSFSIPPDFFEAVQFNLFINFDDGGSTEIVEMTAPDADLVLDMGTDLLAPPTSVAITDEGTERPSVTWDWDGGATIDAIEAKLYWEVGDSSISWQIVLPPDTESPFRTPYLSAAAPTPGTGHEVVVGVVDFSVTDGYEEHRNTFGALIDTFSRFEWTTGVRYRRAAGEN